MVVHVNTGPDHLMTIYAITTLNIHYLFETQDSSQPSALRMQSFRFSSILWGCFLIGKVLSVSLDYVGMDPKPVLCDMSERQHELEFRNKEVVQWESNELATTWGCESSRTQRCISSEQEQWSKYVAFETIAEPVLRARGLQGRLRHKY